MSNRSSHFVHRLQTLPSALAGVPGSRRLLALAVVFALLTLTLLPTTGQAQTYNTEDDPRVPRNLSAQVEVGGVALRWLPPAEDAASVDGYEILRGRPNQGEGTLTTLVSDTGATDTTYFDATEYFDATGTERVRYTYLDATATEGGVRYNYRVKAIRNGVRSDWSNIAQALRPPSTPPPPPPLVSNTGQSGVSAATITWQYAMGFRLGNHGQGYEISSVSIDLASVPSRLTVSLWIGGPPGVVTGSSSVQRKVFDFENPPSFQVGLNKFTAPAGAFAYPNVNYFIVLSDFGSSLSIKETTSDAEDAGGETGAILSNQAKVRAMSSTGRWISSDSRGSVLRLAVEGSTRDRGILASTYAKASSSSQEIISLGDDCCFEVKVGSADRYLIRGVSIAADDTTANGGFFGLPFEMLDASDNKLFGLEHTTAQGPPADLPLALAPVAGIAEYAASQGATLAGSSTYDLHMEVTEIEGDTGATRGGIKLSRVRGRNRENPSDPNIAHDAQYYDTPMAAGVTFGGRRAIALEIPNMAILGEPLYAMVQNLEQANNGYVSLGSEDFKALTQSFTTGFSSYRLQGIGINIEGSDDRDGNPQVPGGPSSVSVAVHISKAGAIGAKLFDLVSPGEFVPGHSFFEAPPGTLLLPRTKYVVAWSYLGGTWHRLQRTSSTDEDSGAQPGFRIDNSLLAGDSPASVSVHSSGDALEMAVYGEPVSETTMVSNLGQSDNGYVSLGGTNSKALTQSFRTGSGSYRLLGIGINIEGSDDTDGNPQVPDGPSSVSVVVHTMRLDSGGCNGGKLFDLVSPDEFELGLNLFEAPREPFWSRTPPTRWCGPTSGARGTDCRRP